MNTVIHVN